MVEGADGVVVGIFRGIPEHPGRKGTLVSPPGVGVSTGGTAALHGHGAHIMDRTLQRGSGGVNSSQSEEVLDGPQGGQDGVQDGMPGFRGFIIHGGVEGAQEGRRDGGKGSGSVSLDTQATMVRAQRRFPVKGGRREEARVVGGKIVPGEVQRTGPFGGGAPASDSARGGSEV